MLIKKTRLGAWGDAERIFGTSLALRKAGQGPLLRTLRARLSWRRPALQGDDGVGPSHATWGTGAQGTLHSLSKTYGLSLPSGDFQDDMTDSLRDYTNLPEAAPLLTILDMSARAKYVMDVEEITPAIVEAFVNDFLAEKLKPEPI